MTELPRVCETLIAGSGRGRFVLDLRMGRIPRPGTELRIRAWMQGYADRAAAMIKEAA